MSLCNLMDRMATRRTESEGSTRTILARAAEASVPGIWPRISHSRVRASSSPGPRMRTTGSTASGSRIWRASARPWSRLAWSREPRYLVEISWSCLAMAMRSLACGHLGRDGGGGGGTAGKPQGARCGRGTGGQAASGTGAAAGAAAHRRCGRHQDDGRDSEDRALSWLPPYDAQPPPTYYTTRRRTASVRMWPGSSLWFRLAGRLDIQWSVPCHGLLATRD